jgi:hypothetical protein
MSLHVNEVSPPPPWLLDLVNKVHEYIEPITLMGQLGYRWLSPENSVNESGVWVLGVYPCANELRGGPKDGTMINPGFRLDISPFLSGFSSIENMAWIHPAAYTGGLEGPRFCIEGTYSDHRLRLQIFAVAPADEDASLVIDMASGNWWQKKARDG